MGWVEFVSALISNVLSWPVVVLVVVMLFRKQVGELLGRLRSYKGLGQELDFGDQLAQAEESVDSAITTPGGSPPAELAPPVEEQDPLAREAEANPSFVVITAWENLSSLIADLAGVFNIAVGGGRRARSSAGIAAELRRRDIVNEEFQRAIRELGNLRNQVAHGNHNPSPGEAVAYVESAHDLMRFVRLILENQRHKSDRT